MAGIQSINPKDIALFASQHSHNRTAAIDSSNRIIGYLTAPAGTLALGPQGNLYDVPFNNTDLLIIYRPSYSEPSATIVFGDFTTVDVAIDQHTGTYAVTSRDFQAGGSNTQVSLYTRDNNACLTIRRQPEGYFVRGSVFDREGRLFVLLSTGPSYVVGEIDGGCKAKRVDISTLPSGLYPNSTLAIDTQDNLVLQNGDDVLTFAHPTHGRFAPPIATTALPHLASLSCLTADGQYLWAAAPEQGRGRVKLLLKYKYPAGDAPVAQIRIDGAFACTTNPPLIP